MEASLRSRLGGRRAISWQAVVIGDLSIITLATLLAATSPGARASVQAAADAFAITSATAVIAAVYTGLAHLTFLRNRRHAPVPVPVAIGFHLSIGVIFLVGFAVGAAILGVPQLGGSLTFSLGVLAGGLFVCVPTTLLLDHSDRYRQRRIHLIGELAELERLSISEWSLRRALRELVARVNGADGVDQVIERLDALELRSDINLATEQLWSVSVTHHQRAGMGDAEGPRALTRNPSADDFKRLITSQLARDYPVVRWSSEFRRGLRTAPRFPGATAGLSALVTLLVLTAVATSVIGFAVGLTTAIGTYVAYTRVPRKRLLVAIAWTGTTSMIWSVSLWPEPGPSGATITVVVLLSVAALIASIVLVAWVSAVVNNREAQVLSLDVLVVERQTESQAVLSSTSDIVSLLARIHPLSDSAAVAACAAGLRRIRHGVDPNHACRILDWTESVVSAPSQLAAVSVRDRLEEVVHPWRALAEISVESDDLHLAPMQIDHLTTAVDQLVSDACRQGQAETIAIQIRADEAGRILIESKHDGSNPGGRGPIVIEFTEEDTAAPPAPV